MKSSFHIGTYTCKVISFNRTLSSVGGLHYCIYLEDDSTHFFLKPDAFSTCYLCIVYEFDYTAEVFMNKFTGVLFSGSIYFFQ